MKLVWLMILSIAALLSSCAGNKAQAQEQVVACDILFEYQNVENDSISLLIGNTMRLHTGKAVEGQFYPLLISVRNPEDLDKPTSTEVIDSEASLLAFLQKRFPLLKSIGIVMGENTSNAIGFSESSALKPIKSLSKKISESELRLFREKGGDIVSVETLK